MLSYLTNCVVLSTVQQEEDYEAWKRARSQGIGGSEIGAICGVSNYATARTVYLRKTMQYDEDFSDEMKQRMEWGHLLEPIVADKYSAETGKKVAVSPATLRHKDHPWAIANVDRFIVDEEGKPIGILECKTTDARNWADWDSGEPPLYYIYQLQWYMWITGLKFGALACLVGGNKFYYLEMYANDDIINSMYMLGDVFWNYHVKNAIEPPLTGADADSELVKGLYKKTEKGAEMSLDDDEMDDLAAFIKDSKAQLKDLEKKVDEASNRIKDKLKKAETGYTTNHIIKWTQQEQERLDLGKLKSEYPEIYEKCKKIISFRVFTVK